ncbi:hypothetical protein ANN_25179 [Periplaneta americana]|uniref:Uncharacterized protein n=1 Tax=Periplaneta americana TaxID=6978 RepID=A0ABQ8S0S7_PERAM|nr:hypothetical protein ANN_25179 [Periplaneta americana]
MAGLCEGGNEPPGSLRYAAGSLGTRLYIYFQEPKGEFGPKVKQREDKDKPFNVMVDASSSEKVKSKGMELLQSLEATVWNFSDPTELELRWYTTATVRAIIVAANRNRVFVITGCVRQHSTIQIKCSVSMLTVEVNVNEYVLPYVSRLSDMKMDNAGEMTSESSAECYPVFSLNGLSPSYVFKMAPSHHNISYENYNTIRKHSSRKKIMKTLLSIELCIAEFVAGNIIASSTVETKTFQEIKTELSMKVNINGRY